MIYPAKDDYLKLALTALESGEVIVYPTDTLYGFGVDATNTDAIKKLNALKGRSQPLSIVLNSIQEISRYAHFDASILDKFSSLFPGPYTALLESKDSDLSPLVQNGSPKIGIRIPNHNFPIQLAEKLEKPVITTSINRHGKAPLNDVTQVEIDFPDVDIFEDTVLHNSKGSTIIDFTETPEVVVRQGDGKYPI